MKTPVLVILGLCAALAGPVTVQAQCTFGHPAKAAKMTIPLVQAHLSCGNGARRCDAASGPLFAYECGDNSQCGAGSCVFDVSDENHEPTRPPDTFVVNIAPGFAGQDACLAPQTFAE